MKKSFLKKNWIVVCLTASTMLGTVPVWASDVQLEERQAPQQTSKITGTVVDEATGEGIIGVTILVKGTNLGTSTDLDGKFSLDAPSGTTLKITYLGYLDKEVQVVSGQPMHIQLKQDSKTLDEVVVVGYGIQKKSSLTGAMQALGEKKLVNITTPKVENMLNGKAPGVFVAAGSGQPGANAKVVIRGKTTVNGSTDPLWVIDGVIVGNSSGDLNPDDIETLSILKDAASTAIYGSQGSNGVVVITTKKGKSGKPTVNFSAKAGVTQLNSGNLDVMNGEELYNLYNSFSNPEAFSQVEWWNKDLKNRNFDWWDNATQTGFAQDYNLSISGGNEKMNTYISLGVYDEDGAVKGYGYTRYSGRFNLNYKVFDWLTIKPLISASRRDVDDQQHSVSAMYNNMPWDSPYLSDGTLVGLPPITTWVNSTGTNYLYDLQWNYTTSRNYELMGNFDFDINITNWLTFSSVNSYRFGELTEMTYKDPRSSDGESSNGSIQNKFNGYDRIYTNQLLRFNKSFDKHSINGIFAYEWNEYNRNVTNGIAAGIPPGFTIANVAMIPQEITGFKNQSAVQSFFTNFNYSYDTRYMAQFSFRRDGASNFGRNNQYGNFFAISGGWNIHEEEFFTADFINNFKLRASYGSTGNRPVELYPQYTLYSLDRQFGYNEKPGALIDQVGNDNLTWEKTFTGNIGLDISFLDRINFSFDAYNKNTSNLLYNVPIPGVTGVTGIYRNVGEVNNKGFEASVSVDIIKNSDLKWSVDANLGLNRNKLTKLYGNKQEIIVGDGSGIAGSASKLLKPGLDVDSWYLPEWAGVDPETGKPQWYATDPATQQRVLTSKYSDASKTPVVTGAYTPDFFGGFSTALNYKHLDFSAVFNYSVGGKIYNYSRAEYDSDGAYTDRNQMNLMDGWSRWEKPGDIATHPQPAYNNKSNSNKASSRYLEDGSYLKLKSLTLGYNIPIKSLAISNLRLYVTGENLLTFTGYSGVDPEIPPVENPNSDNGKITAAKSTVSGVSTAIYPATRKFMFGVSVTF